jgi:hypothetical protein
MIPCPALPGAPALPKQGVYIFLPLHYPVLGDDDLLQEVQ